MCQYFVDTLPQLTWLLIPTNCNSVILGGGQQDPSASTVLRPMKYSHNYDNGWNTNVDSADYNTNNTTTTSFTTTDYSNSTNHHNNYNSDNNFSYEHNYSNGNVASSKALLEEEQLNSCLKKPQKNHINSTSGSKGKI